MRTKLSALCEHVIEAGWLLALITVPLFFNVYSNRVFEPDKISLLRSLAVVMALAWVIKFVEDRLAQPKTAAAQPAPDVKPLDRFLRTPLVIPTLLLAVSYILATITSVVPRVSFWGSYQRLQGTFSTLSYMVIFALMLQTMRRHEQLERALTVIILTSLPISIYGLLQHYDLDPLPWGGDVMTRVASNMGNAIFISAYLILVVPLTLARIIHLQSRALETNALAPRLGFALGLTVCVVLQLLAWAGLSFERGLASALLLIVGLCLVAVYLKRPVARFMLLGIYAMILCVQLVCIFFSQSRGPMLGLLGGFFFFGLLYLFARRWRAAAISVVCLALVGAAFLGVLNLPKSPLARIRELPYVGRLGQIFEVEGGTGKVRVLIWEGAVEMLKANHLRTLIGYGPEAMYVAYNPFYPPDLAHYEARNASPDRSHNETFDALIMTGAMGFVIYMFLFTSLFYYCLKWMGLIRGRAQIRFFLVCSLAGALAGIVLPLLLDGSLRYMGVGLPLGFMMGLSLYVTGSALYSMLKRPAEEGVGPQLAGWRLLLLVALTSAIVAHFVEIHFGIAIGATRTYFWAYAALLVLVGEGILQTTPEESAAASRVAARVAPTPPARAQTRRSAKGAKRVNARQGQKQVALAARHTGDAARGRIVILAVLAGWILMIVAWDYTTNPYGDTNPAQVLLTSLTTMAARRMPEVTSLGMLALALVTFSLSVLMAVAEPLEREDSGRDLAWWLSSLGIAALIAGGMGLIFALVHASRLGPRVDPSRLIDDFYGMLLLVLAAITWLLYLRQPRPLTWGGGGAAIGYVVLLVLAVLLIDGANIRIVKADILYKTGLRFDNESNWDSAIRVYQQVVEVAPTEDFYYLFLGRAQMERGKIEADDKVREVYFERAFESLQKARVLNPLNTDHTANMGRLYRTWGEMEQDPTKRVEHFERSLGYYQQATKLSPNNAQLYNEWGLVYYLLGDIERAQAKYDESLALDQEFTQTYILIGDLHMSRSEWLEAARAYEQAVALDERFVQGWSLVGYSYSQLAEWEKAIAANERILEIAPNEYNTLKNLAILYNQIERPREALAYVKRALTVAPEAEKSMLESFAQQLQAKVEG